MDDKMNFCKTIENSGKDRLKERYDNLLSRWGDVLYDGRNKGVDIYICETCKAATFTRYKDKGVTPYIIHCRHCGGMMKHEQTISERSFPKEISIVKNWVRPTFEQMMTMDKATIEHVLRGGLVLEDDIKNQEGGENKIRKSAMR